mgnify:CR=1 FL=1
MRNLKTVANSTSYLNRWYLVTGTQQEGFIKDLLDGTIGNYVTNFSTSNYYQNIFLQYWPLSNSYYQFLHLKK